MSDWVREEMVQLTLHGFTVVVWPSPTRRWGYVVRDAAYRSIQEGSEKTKGEAQLSGLVALSTHLSEINEAVSKAMEPLIGAVA